MLRMGMLRHRTWCMSAVFGSACFVCAAFSTIVVSGPAAAEPLRVAQAVVGGLPPYEMIAITRSIGLRPLGRPLRQGPHYVLRALDHRGEERRVVIDARYGEVISAVPVVRMPGYSGGARVVRLPREDDEIDMTPPAPIPPRVIPAPRTTAPAPRTSAVAPAEPAAERVSPLPRPRPETTQSTASVPPAQNTAPAKPVESKPAEDKPAEVKKITPAPVPDVVPLD